MRRIPAFHADRQGTASAEFVLMLPLLVVMLFAMFEGGYFLYCQHIVTKAVRDGARFAARANFSNYTNCGAGTVSATVVSHVQELTRTGTLSGGTARLPGWVNSDVTVTCAYNASFKDGIYKLETSGAPTVTVSASVKYKPLFGVLGGHSANLHLNASAHAAVMGI
ncbi:TadE/TadG family type IV pilus assembly protein [Novosphingobium malaysiense]|uniref:TadE/TadG family type IV pilus assembly protein n=1 Tax=Novosphingobium malaysiense TaxID=1348853 RepID=UPI000AFF89B1|nr:TadE/TadG family type IV pilus assembly protein [Novosphingobium malaysiense]